jgi:hypothetical protein
MTDRPVTAVPRGAAGTPAPLSARLEPDAIGVAQNTIIGLGDVGPALSVGLTLAGLAAAAAYAGVPTILVCLVPMLVITSFHRLQAARRHRDRPRPMHAEEKVTRLMYENHQWLVLGLTEP